MGDKLDLSSLHTKQYSNPYTYKLAPVKLGANLFCDKNIMLT